MSEFEWWHDREFELALAEDKNALLPSPSRYPGRWGVGGRAPALPATTPDWAAERLRRDARAGPASSTTLDAGPASTVMLFRPRRRSVRRAVQ